MDKSDLMYTVLMICIGLFVGALIAKTATDVEWKNQIIQRGYAHYTVNETNGVTTFTWKDK